MHAQPSVKADYYAPVQSFLREAMRGDRQRVEVVPVEHHWEAAYSAQGHLHRARLGAPARPQAESLFYEDENGGLTPEAYRHWLDDPAVGYVAAALTASSTTRVRRRRG